MNEISNYDPETYHATLTQSVFVRLEGSIIRLSKPNHNIARRATHNEPKPDVTYISQKIYDITNSKVCNVSQIKYFFYLGNLSASWSCLLLHLKLIISHQPVI